jgi:PKD repeat protein/Flp pilus assembly protein TadG
MHRLATRLRTHLHSRTRGQSLVEFALVLPIIMMLTLTALDFGRVYLGYINLQNMARVAANFAANNPLAWTPSTDPAIQANRDAAKTKYQNEIRADATATNCNLPVVGGVQTAPDPTFTDADGDGTPEIGDVATVGVSCTFGVITPVISNIVGGSVQVSAASKFPVKSGMTAAMGAAVIGTAPNAAFIGNGVGAPSTLVGTTPFTVVFHDTSGGNPTAWEWHFVDSSTPDPVTTQDPLHVFDHRGTFLVTMTASNIWGSSTTSMGITVNDPSTVDFTMNRSSGNAPLAVTFTDASGPGGTNYAWTFGAGQGSASGTSASHTYNAAGSYTVTLTVTFPSGPVQATKTVTVGAAQCLVPQLSGVKWRDAQSTWSAAGFSGLVSRAPGAPNNNGFTISSQSVTFGTQQPCTSNVAVSG